VIVVPALGASAVEWIRVQRALTARTDATVVLVGFVCENWLWLRFWMLLVILGVSLRSVCGRVAAEGFAAVGVDPVGVG
jgi:hypothetical protein